MRYAGTTPLLEGEVVRSETMQEATSSSEIPLVSVYYQEHTPLRHRDNLQTAQAHPNLASRAAELQPHCLHRPMPSNFSWLTI